jgi:heterotetrameric sarcosine oxidase gamma subunit
VADPVARSAVAQAPPVVVRDGWEVSARRSRSVLRLQDASALGKVLVRAAPGHGFAEAVGVGFGRTGRSPDRSLVVGSGPDEWTVLCLPGRAGEVAERMREVAGGENGLRTVLDVTHGRALFRLTGPASARLLAGVCAVDLADRCVPDGSALRTEVARLATDLVRADLAGPEGTEPSYLLHCERSSGRHLFEALLDAGALLGVDVDGLGSGEGAAAALGGGAVPASGRPE